MSGASDIEDLAAEYVLGTLDAGERVAVSARRQREPTLDDAIAAWERRLTPLDVLVQPVAAPPGLFAAIEPHLLAMPMAAAGRDAPATATIIDLQRRLKRWRVSALAASAIAASLLMAFGIRETLRPVEPQNFVAVFQQGNTSPSFVMTVDVSTRTLSVRRVDAQVPKGWTYELWIVSDKLAPGPHSLGLADHQNTVVQHAISNLDTAAVENATYGVSLEREGGSKTGKPSDTVFLARLIPTAR